MKKENGNDMPFKTDEVNWDEISGIGIMKEELEYFEKSEDNRLFRFDGDEDRMNEYEKRLMGRKVKE